MSTPAHSEKKYLEEAEPRRLAGLFRRVARLLAIGLSLFHLYTAYFGTLELMQQRSLHLTVALVLVFLTIPATARSPRDQVTLPDLVWAAATMVSGVWIFFRSQQAVVTVPGPTGIVMGAIMILAVLEATRRAMGWPLTIIAGVALAFAYWGRLVPIDLLRHRGYYWSEIVFQTYIHSEGIFGTPLGVSATYIVLFILFGALLQASGAGQFFIDLAAAGFGAIRGGPAKVAVVASAFFGSINGTATANVVGTGTFTIPLMKRTGYTPAFSAAVEAVASSGGQFMPPVMGSAAFIIAETLGKSYGDVVVAALLPAILYYVAVFVMVDLEAVKRGIRGLPRAELPALGPTLRFGWHLLIPPVLLVLLMTVVGYSTMKSAFWSCVALVVVAQLVPRTRMSLGKFLDALEAGATGTLGVATATAAAGIVIGVITQTGVGFKLSNLLIALAGGSLFALLLLTMVASLILGMGLPTVAAYLVLAIMVAPALVKMGVLPMAAHLFIFYFGIMSALTPPVALAAYAGAAIAKANPMTTGWTAMRLALAAFIVPFNFVYAPQLLLLGSPGYIALAVASSLVGVYALGAAVQGHWLTPLPPLERVVLLAAALLLIHGGLITDAVGYGLFALMLFWQWRRRRARSAVRPLEQSAG